jgi:type I restriction enzyme, S subunit
MASEWRIANLVDVCDRVSVGYVGPTSEYFCAPPHGVRMLRSQNVRPGRLDLDDVKHVEREFHSKNKKSQLRAGDLLFVRVGQNRGDCCVVPEGAGELNCANIVFARPRKTLGAFLGFYFRSPVGQQQLRSISTGSAQGVLNTGAIASLKVPVPSDAEAEAIAAVLGALDSKIELNRRMNATLEAMARALFKSWFVDFDPVRAKPDGRQPASFDNATAALFPSAFEDADCGEMPKGWRCGSVGDLGVRILDKVGKQSEWAAQPLIDLSRIPQRSVALGEWGLGAELTTSVTRFAPKDILFGAIRPYFHKVGIAPVHGVTNVSVFVIRARQAFDWPFLAALCSLDTTVKFATRVSKGTKMPVVGWPDFANYQIVVPPPQVRRAFGDLVAPMFDRIIANLHESRTLATLRDTLLPKLLSGELSVAAATIKRHLTVQPGGE